MRDNGKAHEVGNFPSEEQQRMNKARVDLLIGENEWTAVKDVRKEERIPLPAENTVVAKQITDSCKSNFGKTGRRKMRLKQTSFSMAQKRRQSRPKRKNTLRRQQIGCSRTKALLIKPNGKQGRHL